MAGAAVSNFRGHSPHPLRSQRAARPAARRARHAAREHDQRRDGGQQRCGGHEVERQLVKGGLHGRGRLGVELVAITGGGGRMWRREVWRHHLERA
eukprot:CAMPEP_0179971288 /NCGR_PEP_ID=MMETSP0983-20121128/35902_1 /TAXON_ID=483367 /ORGANISM="non described non described, Strain CCMP 2436" /LENGTH=95 /DNA_ID=CAMNT_0021886311 /DNA_START=98 /DNA_END=385 /DNA_ORIENTATION=-